MTSKELAARLEELRHKVENGDPDSSIDALLTDLGELYSDALRCEPPQCDIAVTATMLQAHLLGMDGL
ncbi:hypothetical protein [Pseudaeromonas pectinilytica]|jgi:hypothetical protein